MVQDSPQIRGYNHKLHTFMDIEHSTSRPSVLERSRPSVLERSSLHSSSVMSLERFTLPRNSSLSRRASLLSAMDLELSRHSSRTDFLGEGKPARFSDNQRDSAVYEYKIDVEEKDLSRKSQCKIAHECACSGGCLGVHCICFLTPREICVIGQCCAECIAAKNEYLQTIRGFELERERRARKAAEEEVNPLLALRQKNYRNMHYYKHAHADEPLVKDLVFCTCKKSHCQKKYCLCFEKGLKCGEFCVCLECENRDEEEAFREEEQRRWQRYATYKPYDEKEENAIDGDIDQFLEDQQEKGAFEGTMEFQPVNFDRILYNNYQ